MLVWRPSGFAGGLKMGLGNAAAHTGSAVIAKATEIDRLNSTGDSVANLLPPCTDTPYSVSPIALADIQAIDPLGHVNPPGHTFPSDHIYFYIAPIVSSAPTGPRVVTNLLAPGDMHITAISSSYVNGNPATIDYGMEFFACRELKSYFGHVKSLSAPILTALNSSDQHCMDYSTGGNLFHRCDATTNIIVSAGDVIGTAGGTAAALDFGSYDYRRTPLTFSAPSRHYSNQAFTVCPIDYFAATIKNVLEPHLGQFDGGHQRTAIPLCGEILYDVTGTAFGDWYKIGAPDSPEDPHLSLIKDNVYNPRQVISIGTSVTGASSRFFPFDPLTSGTHNRDFGQVSADGQVYCYDTFYDPVGQPAFVGYSMLITMPTSTTIRIEKYNVIACGSGPWTMGSSYTEFQR